MLFMNTPYWRAVEREMQTVPNFKPRRSGFRVNGVTLDRFRGYKNAAARLLYRWKRNDVTERIAAMYRKSGSFFADSDHKNFFAEFIKNNPYGGSRFYAAVFLLSADFNLRKRSETAVTNGTVDFGKIDLKGISADGYTLYKAAKTVYTQNPEITYGSNINLKQMAQRCPTAEKLTTGVIPNYELEFRSVATIVPKENGNVPVLMWDIKPADEKALDRYEGFPRLYRKEYFSLEYGGETHKAMAYIMNSGQICEPSQAYYNCILEGYKAVGLDTSHLENALARSIEFGEQNHQLDFFDRRFDI